jgi:hypothetical protein
MNEKELQLLKQFAEKTLFSNKNWALQNKLVYNFKLYISKKERFSRI